MTTKPDDITPYCACHPTRRMEYDDAIGAYYCPLCGRYNPLLVKGGQGRRDDDVAASAAVIAFLAIALIAIVIIAAITSGCSYS